VFKAPRPLCSHVNIVSSYGGYRRGTPVWRGTRWIPYPGYSAPTPSINKTLKRRRQLQRAATGRLTPGIKPARKHAKSNRIRHNNHMAGNLSLAICLFARSGSFRRLTAGSKNLSLSLRYAYVAILLRENHCIDDSRYVSLR